MAFAFNENVRPGNWEIRDVLGLAGRYDVRDFLALVFVLDARRLKLASYLLFEA